MIDYIFFSSQLLRTVGLLGPLDIDWIKSNKIVGFPHPHVPSDHLPLMVELELITNQNNNHSSSNNSTSSTQNQNTNLHHFCKTYFVLKNLNEKLENFKMHNCFRF